MDEKGFMIGQLQTSRRYFTSAEYHTKKLRGAGQDGSREWITVIGSICQDFTALPPAIIFAAATNNHQDTWYEDLDTPEAVAHFITSPTGWTNDEIGYEWLTKIFERHTKNKLRKENEYRLLFVDGHSSHLNLRFIEYCDENRILLMAYPPHSTHRLQPLDVSLFNPLANFYSQNLNTWLYNSRGICSMSKRHFWCLFEPAFHRAFTRRNIESAWKKTGLHPLNPEVVLRQVRSAARPVSSSSSSGASASISNWKRADKQFLKAHGVPVTYEEKRVKKTFDAVFNKVCVLSLENEMLRTQLELQNKQGKRSQSLFGELRANADNKALFFSPKKVQEAKALLRARELAKEEEEDEKRLRKAAREQAKILKKEELQKRRELRDFAKQEKQEQLAEQRRLREEARIQKQAEKQLALDAQNAKKQRPRPRAKSVRFQVENEGVNKANLVEEIIPPPTSSGRQRRLPQRLRE